MPFIFKILILLELCVDNDQPTAAISTADISSKRRCTDVDISLLSYLGSRTCVRTYLIECLVAISKFRKSGWVTFI